VISATWHAQAIAQPIARGDVTGIISWFNADSRVPSSYNDWYNRSLYGGAAVGWYWTDHLKTELDVGATSHADVYAARSFQIDGQWTSERSEHRFSTRRFTAGQQYQFYRNAWAHPHVAAGVDLTWRAHQQHDEEILVYDSASRTSRVVRPARTVPRSTDLEVRPFAEIGAKLYLSRRGFLRTDLRMTFNGGADEVLFRFGCGVDF
jgi:hypothetical protein